MPARGQAVARERAGRGFESNMQDRERPLVRSLMLGRDGHPVLPSFQW